MLTKGCSLFGSQVSRSSLVDPPAHPSDRAHQVSFGCAAVHDVLYIGINVSWKVVIQESLDIGVLHDQMLLCFTDRVTFIYLSSTITETMRKHRMKPSINFAETS